MKKVITQKQMNKIIDSIAADYREDIFEKTTIKETNEFSEKVKRYLLRVAANMARVICMRVKKELVEYFEEETT